MFCICQVGSPFSMSLLPPTKEKLNHHHLKPHVPFQADGTHADCGRIPFHSPWNAVLSVAATARRHPPRRSP